MRIPNATVSYKPRRAGDPSPIVLRMRAFWASIDEDYFIFLDEDEALELRRQLGAAVRASRAAGAGSGAALVALDDDEDDRIPAGGATHDASPLPRPAAGVEAPAAAGDFFARRRLADG